MRSPAVGQVLPLADDRLRFRGTPPCVPLDFATTTWQATWPSPSATVVPGSAWMDALGPLELGLNPASHRAHGGGFAGDVWTGVRDGIT